MLLIKFIYFTMGNDYHFLLEFLIHLRTMLVVLIQAISTELATARWRSIENYKKKTRHLDRERKVGRKRRLLVPRAPRKKKIEGIDIYDRTGIEKSTFKEIFCAIRQDLENPRTGMRKVRVTLSSESRLLMVLQWLREYPNFKVLAQMYFVSRFYAQREIRHIIPILFVKLNYIGWPAQYNINSLGVHAVIDCSAHPRLRVHPGSADYYRGDKRRNMEVSQVVCGLQGEIYDIVIGKGHNNDQAMFNISGLRMHIELNDFILLADRGYSHHLIITPAKPEWSELASHDRVIVENVFGEAKQFSATSAVF